MAVNKLWSGEEERVAITMLKAGATYPEIGRRLDRTGESVRKLFRRKGITPNRILSSIARESRKQTHKAWTRPEKHEAKSLLENGMAVAAVAEHFGRSETSVRKFIWRANNPIYRDPSGVTATRSRVAPWVIEARDRRLEEPRSLTMEFCGDPEPSRSALGRFCP